MQQVFAGSARDFVARKYNRGTVAAADPELPLRGFIQDYQKAIAGLKTPVSREVYDAILADLLGDWASSEQDCEYVAGWVADRYVIVGAVAA